MTDGIEGLIVETHNWGKTVAFWKGLGYELEAETGQNWGVLRHPRGGPYVFVAERPQEHVLQWVPVFAVPDPARFTPPRAGEVVRPFEAQHWNVLEMVLADPDGRHVSLQSPLPPGAHHGG